jgi:hypothetical protein
VRVALDHKRGHLDFLDERTSEDDDEKAANELASDSLLPTAREACLRWPTT